MVKFCIQYITIFFCILLSTTSYAQLTDVMRQGIINKNLYDPYNGGFESGLANWTASGGSAAAVSSGTNLLIGKGSATWDSNGAAQTWSAKLVTIPKGLYGRNGVFQCLVMVPSGSATHTFEVYDGTNILSSTTVTSSTIPTLQVANFIFPSSGSVRGRLVAVNANEPSITVDDCYLGAASNLSNISQAQFIGDAKIAGTAGSRPARTNTALGAFSTDVDTPGPTVLSNPGPGIIQTTDADLPQFTVNSLPPGTYQVIISLDSFGATNGQNYALAINDGTTTSASFEYQAPGSSLSDRTTMVANFTYTSSGNKTFAVWGAGSSGALTIENSVTAQPADIYFSITRFPSPSQIAATQDQLPGFWSGRHEGDCSWDRTSTAFGDYTADATCTFTEMQNSNFGTVTSATSGGNKLPGIVFTPKRAGRYLVTATFFSSNGTANGINAWSMTDGVSMLGQTQSNISAASEGNPVSMTGITSATSISAKTITIQGLGNGTSTNTIGGGSGTPTALITWSVVALDQQYPQPQYVGSVTNSGTGQVKIEAVELNCDGSSTIVRQLNGSNWVSSIGNISAGICAVAFVGTPFSATPYCVATNSANAFADIVVLNETTSGLDIKGFSDTAGAATSFDVHMMCIGTK